MTTVGEADAWIGRVAIDRSGRRAGRITRVWIDDYSGRPAWATVATRRRDSGDGREAIAPLSAATAFGNRPQLACTRADVTSAPQVEDDAHLGLDDEWRLINHYDLPGAPERTSGFSGCELAQPARRWTTSTITCVESDAPGSGTSSNGSPAQAQDPRSEPQEFSKRLSLPGIRRMLGLR